MDVVELVQAFVLEVVIMDVQVAVAQTVQQLVKLHAQNLLVMMDIRMAVYALEEFVQNCARKVAL